MKKNVTSFLLGVFLTIASITVYGEVESYYLKEYSTPIYIQNVKYPEDSLPVLSLEANGGDNTYVPLRSFSEILGFDVDYDNINKRIDIKLLNDSNSDFENNEPTIDDTLENFNLEIYTLNGLNYVLDEDIEDEYFIDYYDDYEFEDDNFEYTKQITLEKGDKTILSDISAIKEDENYLIDFEYFKNTIFPLLTNNQY